MYRDLWRAYWEPVGCIGNPEGVSGTRWAIVARPLESLESVSGAREGVLGTRWVYWEPRGVYWEPRGGVLGTWGVGLGELEAAEKFAIVSPFAMSRAV